MKLTVFPLRPFAFEPNQLNVLETGSTIFYKQLVETFIGESENTRLTNDENEEVNGQKQILWVGNPAFGIDFDSQFLKPLTKSLLNYATDAAKVKLLDAQREVSRLVLDASFSMDVPLAVKDNLSLESIIKFSGLHLEMPPADQICAKIELLFKILQEISDSRLVVITDLSHFVDAQELTHLVEQVTDSELTVLLIEFSNTSRASEFKKCRYYYVDEDLVDFR